MRFAGDDGIDKGRWLAGTGPILVAVEVLRKGPQKHWAQFAARIVHLEVVKDANDLKGAGVLRQVDAEVLADGVLIGKKALDELLVDDRNRLRCLCVLVREVAAMNHGHADGLKKMRTDPVPRGSAFFVGTGGGVALLNDALAPVIAFERTVEGHADVGDAGQRRKPVFDLAVERGNPIQGIAGTGRVEVKHVSICGRDAEILMLQVIQRLGHQDGAGQQHKRQRGLKDNERPLRKCGTIARGTIDSAQNFSRLSMRRQPGRPEAEEPLR